MAIELLRDIASDGYPTDYLLARVRARRAALTAQWRAIHARGLPAEVTDDAIWEGFLRELGWLRGQMNRRLRTSVDPVFGLFELKTLVLCLRCKAVQRDAEIARLLAASQVSDALRQALLQETDVPAAVASIAVALEPADDAEASLRRAYAQAGLKGFETRLTRSYLGHVNDARLHPLVRRFFASFVDLRNLMTLYKLLRWEMDDAAAFLTGGTIGVERLQRIGAARDAAGLDPMVREIAGRAAPPLATAEGSLETILLGSLSHKVRSLGRQEDPVGTVLDHAWRVYIHARNQSLLLHAGHLDSAGLEKELVA
ncbi:MAG: V-type ATPase subunit [Gammaproteobacteria bacterium]|nr:V-type ATPase subunit [Gammaproteobacteria bacterium]MDH5274118.1 V-type ATPase subunit [Gammaproteobacteria bacterium]